MIPLELRLGLGLCPCPGPPPWPVSVLLLEVEAGGADVTLVVDSGGMKVVDGAVSLLDEDESVGGGVNMLLVVLVVKMDVWDEVVDCSVVWTEDEVAGGCVVVVVVASADELACTLDELAEDDIGILQQRRETFGW